MAVDAPLLPTQPDQLAAAIDSHVGREESRLSFRRMMWLMAYYYLNGARRFEVVDPYNGRVKASVLDKDGSLEFQASDLLVIMNRVVSKLCAVNLLPRVLPIGTSLQVQRERGIAQLFLDNAVSPDDLRRVTEEFAVVFATCGSAGVMGHIVDHATIGLVGDLEVVHPSEVFPWPSVGINHTAVRGLVRQRYVPLQYLKDLYGKKIGANLQRMDYYKIAHGEMPQQLDGFPSSVHEGGNGRSGSYKGGLVIEEQEVVKVREVWMNGPRGTCGRYVLTSGEAVIRDEDLSRKEVYCPLGWARFYESGTFHGLGLFDSLFSTCRQGERMAKQLFQNTENTDKYGVLVIPSGQWSERSQLRPLTKGLNVLPWEPDPLAEGFRPFAMAPANSGDVPGKVAQFARHMMDELSPLKDLSEEKGRVDSFSGLQLIDQELNQPMAKPAQSMERAFSSCYRGVCQTYSAALAGAPRPIPVTRLSLDLAGVVIDPVSGDVTFNNNPLPDISRLSFRAAEVSARSEAAKKQESLTLIDKGVHDGISFRLYCIKEGLPVAMYNEGEEAAYETVTRNILLLFGDGETPGEAIVTPGTSNADIQIRVLSAFMQRPVVGLASVPVQNALIQYRETLMSYTQSVLPPGVPAPEDASLMSMMGQQQHPLALAQ